MAEEAATGDSVFGISPEEERIERAIRLAESLTSDIPASIFAIKGYSDKQVRIFLHELVEETDSYLEIGVWHGATFAAAVSSNPRCAIAIDNFSQFEGSIGSFRDNLKDYRYEIWQTDCFALTDEQKGSLGSINVYFYDGNHSREDQAKAVTYYSPLIAKRFILIVDDWNHPNVANGTMDGLKDIKVLKSWTKSWWQGVWIGICER